MKSKIDIIKIPSLISAEKFDQVQKLSNKIQSNTVLLDWDENFKRYTGHNLSLFLSLLPEIQEKIKSISSVPSLKFSFCYYSFYSVDGVCPPHIDRKECAWTVNWCINQDFQWPIIVEDQEFHLLPNEAIIYKGASQKHWRDKNPSNKSCDMCVYCFEEAL